MKTLNRPMFRYGGPIKEGVMNGIREPKKHGGSMGINTPKRGLVDGPGSYAGFIPPLIAAGSAALRYLPSVYRGIRGSKFVRGFKPTGNLFIKRSLLNVLYKKNTISISNYSSIFSNYSC